MMIFIVFLSCLFVLSVAPAKANQTAQVRRLIQAAYDKQDIAYDHKDINGVMAFYAPNWTNGDSSYKVMYHRYDARDAVEAMGINNGHFLVVQEIIKFSLNNNHAVAIVKESIVSGPSRKFGLAAPQLIYTGINRDTWELTRKGWLMTRSYMDSGRWK